MVFLNPFKKYDLEDFPYVYVPLVKLERRPRGEGTADNAAAEDSDKTPLNRDDDDGDADADLEVLDGDGDDADSDDGLLTLEQLRKEIEGDSLSSSSDCRESTYDRKARVINKAIQDIGMGSYQWKLFILCGFGWLADNLWLQGVALTLNSLSQEYGVSASNVRYTTLAVFVGLCVGASFWGTVSDIVGRKPAFNLTLFICAVFGSAVGLTNTWIQACVMYAFMSCGVGGNLPVDGALFLEFLPYSSGNLLTMLSVWWPFGQLLASLIAWGFVTQYSCATDLESCAVVAPGQPCCTKADNMGWRYMNFCMGAFTFGMFICRFLLFHLFESPKFLLSRGRQREAVSVIRGLAHANGTTTWLSEDILNEIGGGHGSGSAGGAVANGEIKSTKIGYWDIIKRSLARFSTDRVKPLFASRQLGLNTVLLWFTWLTIGAGYPLFNAFLPQYLRSINPDAPPTPNAIVYRNFAITSIVGCPGSVIACYTVDLKSIGRKGTMAISTLLTSIFIYVFTLSASPSFQLIFSCLVAFFQNVMYGVLYAYTPETFPAPNRGTGTGVASFFNRIAGVLAPVVAVKGADVNPKVPVYVSAALMGAAFLAMVGLPIETRGRQSL